MKTVLEREMEAEIQEMVFDHVVSLVSDSVMHEN